LWGSSPSLEKLLDLFNKAGETTHVGEVIELLAHASVQSGDLLRARDLYQKLAQIEPQNPLHMQNYQQVVSQLGGASGSKLITPEEAVVLIDDLEATAPSIHQHYSDEVALAIRSSLTDAELFISYNMPAKALGPLVAALPMAPNDLRLNQRLAALHTRAGRFAEAALCCRTLQAIYSDSEHPEEATRYGELAERYEERSSTPAPEPSSDETHIFLDSAPQVDESSAPEFSIDEAPVEAASVEEYAVQEEHEAAPEAQAASPWPTSAELDEITVEAATEDEFAVVDEASAATAEPAAPSTEIDLSSEWDDDTITVETDEHAAEVAEVEVASTVGEHELSSSSKADEAVEEIRFYLAHGMPEQAMAALAKLQTLTSDRAKVAQLRAEVEAATPPPADEEVVVAEEPVVEELAAEEAPVAVEPEPEPPVTEEIPVVAEASFEPEPVAPKPEPKPSGLKALVSDLETSLGDGFLPRTVAKPVASPVSPPAAVKRAEPVLAPAAHTEPAIAARHTAPVLGEFVADIEASLGEDFLKAAPVAEPQPPAPVAKAKPAPPIPTPVAPRVAAPFTAPKISSPLAASAAASASPTSHAAPPAHQSAATTAPAVAWPTPAVEAPKPQPPAAPPSHAPAAPAKASPFGDDAGVDLAEMFGELRQDLEAGATSADEDPETHYNLGIAFREMGLLDEAIGELQKACQFFDRGHPFPQIMQTYTWLAQCFLEKGVPEAAVRWYDKALNVPGIDGETRVALHYELASAYETAGDKSSALKHFMDVYGANIDYRDVAERIKVLKS